MRHSPKTQSRHRSWAGQRLRVDQRAFSKIDSAKTSEITYRVNNVNQICAPQSGTNDAGIIDADRRTCESRARLNPPASGQSQRLTQTMPLGLSLYTYSAYSAFLSASCCSKSRGQPPATLSLSGFCKTGGSWRLVLYGFTTLGWVWILRHAPLHVAYPFMGLAFLIVPTLAWLLLGNRRLAPSWAER